MSAGTNPETPTLSSTPSPETTGTPPVVRRRRGRTGLYAVIGVIIVVIVLVAVGASTNWYGLQKSSTKAAACTSGVTLQGDGAQIAAPLMGVWTSAYASDTSNQVNYPASGSGTGLTHFTSTSIDFAMTDNPLTPAERTAMPAQPLSLPFVGGALAIIYNLGALPGLPLSGHLNLTGAVLAGIYNLNITKWNDPAIAAINPGVTLPDQTIWTVHRGDAAGTTYVLSDFLSQSSTYWASHESKGMLINFPSSPNQNAPHGNSAVINAVVGKQYSIGYSDLTDLLASASPPQYAAIQNPAGNYIVPTLPSTESAVADKVQSMATIPASTGDWFNVSMVKANGSADYPIATFLYMYVYQATDKGFSPTLEKSQVLVQWVHWTLTTGQGLADESQPSQLYYAPLPASIITVDEAGIQTMTFNGAAIPACT
ncbi:MAG TPA: phosphate ABC transporter substrate-binding protein PstS [Thermoplasmata archaeon]